MAAAVRLVFFVSFVSRALSQAPGDGDSFCVDPILNGEPNVFFTNITYPANEHPLMDSRDYVALLDGDNPTWQQVDNDNNNTNLVATHWGEATSVACEVTVEVCGFGDGAQENWLITQHISRELAGGQRLKKVTARFQFTLNGCDITRQCRQSFDVYKWQTSTPNRTAARNTDSYERVGRVFPDDTSGTVVTTKSLDIELNAESGFYLAVVDLSTCIVIRHILVFYYVCVGETSDLITRPETIDVGTTVTGECVENSSPDGGPNPLVRCGDEGQWEIILPCRCNPGYVRNGSQCSACPVGTYSEGGDSSCQPCNSNAECPCVPGYYRAPGEGPSVACTQSPSAPLNVSVCNVTNTSVFLSWLPSEDGGGRNLSEIFYTITALNTSGSFVLGEVTGTETPVMHLTPAVNYTFLVTAENDVSFQDTNIGIRSANVTATTEEGAAGMVTMISAPDSGSTVVSWSPPNPPNGVILYYNIRINNSDNGDLVAFIEEQNVTSIDVAEYGESGGKYTVEVQAVTTVGAGNFSSPVIVELDGSSDDSSSSSVVGIVVAVIVVVIIVLSVVAILLIVYILWYRHHVRHKQLYHGIDLPKIGRRMYVDPKTYEHVDEAVHDFAVEIHHKSLRLTEEIGNGEFGNVYRGIWKTEDKEELLIAVKTLKPGSSEKMRDDFLTEASIMGQFDHPNVIKLYGVLTRVEPVMIVMEYMEKGSLYYYLRKYDEQLTDVQQVKLALGVAKGMDYLAEVGYVHRDLAARNILVDRDDTTKVADFGLSRETVEDVYEVRKGGKIPVRWTAPEAIAYRKFTTSSDVWSFGVLLWEVMSYGQQPYEEWDNQTVLTKLDAGHRLQKPRDCPDTVYNCMLECWNADRKKRPSFSQVVRILEILLESNVTDGPKAKPRASKREVASPLDHKNVADWLQSIKMDKYEEKFQEAGYATIQNCLTLNAEDLNRMGITLAGHQNKIISSIRVGRDHFERQQSVRI